MPYINRKFLSPKRVPYRNEVKEQNNSFYGSMAWRRFRDTYVSLYPLCQECLKHDRVNPTEHIHHIKPFMSGNSEEERWRLFLDENNVIALCSTCHHAIHNKINKYNMAACSELTDKEYVEIHNIE